MNRKNNFMKKIQGIMLCMAIVLTTMIQPVTANAAPAESSNASLGIDVSRYQGQIDWSLVAQSGVQFAMIRVGYRTQATGVLNEDPYARYNLQEAQKYGIKVGAYFFSSAINYEEAIEEANFTANLIDKYQITYPVAFDCEGFSKQSSRQYGLGKDVRTALAVAFLDTIVVRGYTPMFYASKNEMTNSAEWDMNTLASRYKIWVSWYPSVPFPGTPACTYPGTHSMWQYSAKSTVPGVSGTVDMNVAYFSYTETASAKDTSGAEEISAENASNVQFTDVYEVVTAKNITNLRTVPSSASPDTIVTPISNGDMIYRTGIGNNGWSRVLLNGQVLYANTSYLVKIS